MKAKKFLTMALLGAAVTVSAQQINPGGDPHIDPKVRVFLKGLNEATKGQPPIYKLKGTGPADALTALQDKTPLDMSGVEVTQRTITQDGISVDIHIMRPAGASGVLPVIVFYHGGVWLVGNYENHKRLVRDLVVGTNAVAVFVDYTLIPEARFP